MRSLAAVFSAIAILTAPNFAVADEAEAIAAIEKVGRRSPADRSEFG